MPIRLNRKGAPIARIAVIALFFVVLGFGPTGKSHSDDRIGATKGVRPKMAYLLRHLGVAKASAAYSRRYVAPSLPAEEAGDEATAEVVNRAMSLVGTRYRWGGNGVGGVDCSGLVRYAYGDRAGSLPRTSYAQRATVPNASTLRPGDILFFGWGRAYHVGIYVGSGNFVHASTYSGGVRVDNLARMIPYLGFMGSGRI